MTSKPNYLIICKYNYGYLLYNLRRITEYVKQLKCYSSSEHN